MRFNRAAFIAILDRSNYSSRTAFAEAVGISPGSLHDVISGRREPSTEMIRKFATELRVPLPALILNQVEAKA